MCRSLASNFSETKGKNTPLIIYHPVMNSQFNFIDILLTDLKLETQVENSNKGAEMCVIVLFGEAISKHRGGDKQGPHGSHQRHKG
jgi:hypothetical protein